LDVPEGHLCRNTLICKELEDLPGLVQVVVALGARRIHTFFGHVLGGIHVLSDVMNQALDQMVMEPLIAVVDKTQQVQVHDPGVQPLQPEDRVIRHQGRIIFDAFLGNLQRW
jgi:hypothetical protein